MTRIRHQIGRYCFLVVSGSMGLIMLTGCLLEPNSIEVTRVVEKPVQVTRIVEEIQEVTRIVEIPIEITTVVEERVEVTVEVPAEVTRIVEVIVEISSTPPPTPTPAPTQTSLPPPPEDNVVSNEADVAKQMDQILRNMGGMIDTALRDGVLYCDSWVSTWDTFMSLPASGERTTFVQNHILAWNDMTENCREFLRTDAAGTIPFQQWGTIRQAINEALERIRPLVEG